MKKLAAIYSKQLISNPLRTNIVTGGILAAGSDIICQTLIEEQDDEPFNYKRTLAITTFGMYYNGGLCSFIYPLCLGLPLFDTHRFVSQDNFSTSNEKLNSYFLFPYNCYHHSNDRKSLTNIHPTLSNVPDQRTTKWLQQFV